MDARTLADPIISVLVSAEGPALAQAVSAKAKSILSDTERASLKTILTDLANDL